MHDHSPPADRPADSNTHVTQTSGDGQPRQERSGSRVGAPMPRRYRILRPHARGSLGQVHVAQDEELNREVALKELQDHCAEHVESHVRFLREAEITAALEHPCIVPVYGRGHQPDGRPYYAMRLIRGESLDSAIARYHKIPTKDTTGRALAFRDLLTRFVAVCQAVAYAHSCGVIHRDLKPGNVMLGPFGETLVVDWGLARHFARPETAGVADDLLPISATPDTTATQEGQIVGTPAYMSPEQAAGQSDLGPSTDIYSLGGILYAILTGQPPLVPALAPLLMVANIDRTPAAPRLVKPGVSAALEAVCLRAMSSRPEDRYASADELAREVQRWLADEPVRARPESLVERTQRWARRHRSIVVGLAVLLLASVVGLAAGLWAVSIEKTRTAEQRDQARTAQADAEWHFFLAEQAHVRAEENLTTARRNLEQADRNLQLARKAVEECFVLVTSEPLLKSEAAHQFRRRMLKAALPYYREFQTRKPNDHTFDLDLAKNLTRVATIEAELGEPAESRTHADRAYRLCDDIARKPNLTPLELQDLADYTNNIGSVYHALGQMDIAVTILSQARTLQERLVNQKPKDLRARLHLGKMTYNLGLVEASRQRPTQAMNWYEAALKLEANLLADHPDHAELLASHVQTWRSKASLLDEQKQHDESDLASKKAEEWGEKLLKLPSISPDHVRTVATTFSDHAAARSNLGKSAEALPLLLRAISLQEPLCRQAPQTRYLHDLGIMTLNLSVVYYKLRKADEELATLKKARRTWAELASRRPEDKNIQAQHGQIWLRWARSAVYRIDRLIKANDPVAASREIDRLAAETEVYRPMLLNYAAVCGRWLNAFAKNEGVSATQRNHVIKMAVEFLLQAKREGGLTEEAFAVVKKDTSFETLRENAEVKKVLGGEQ